MQETSVPTLDEIRRELGLTVKQMDFALAYVGKAKFNATKAAEIAGYDGDYNILGVTGHDNLKNPKIIEYIRILTEQRLKDAGYCVDRVTKEILDIAFYNPKDLFVSDEEGYLRLSADEWENIEGSAIKSITSTTKKRVKTGEDSYTESWVTKIEFHDKKWALEMLSKLLDMESGEQMGKKTRQTFHEFMKEALKGDSSKSD
jgi:phage terminase small subunit